MALKFITAEEAASFVHHNDNVGFSGFTPAGNPKVVPGAIARKAIAEHEKGNPFQIGMFTGASTGDKLDGELARAKAIKFRTPYQSSKDLRALLNARETDYFDMHLSELAQDLRYGFLGKIDVAIVEAAEVTEDGEIVPTSGVGILPTICIMLIMRCGQVLNVGYEKVYLLQNAMNLNASEVINTYVYKQGLSSGLPQYSLATAIGLFVSVVNLIVLVAVNRLSASVSGNSLW